jgi:hypothetical protein
MFIPVVAATAALSAGFVTFASAAPSAARTDAGKIDPTTSAHTHATITSIRAIHRHPRDGLAMFSFVFAIKHPDALCIASSQSRPIAVSASDSPSHSISTKPRPPLQVQSNSQASLTQLSNSQPHTPST